jgi:hypothetical protein
MSYKGFTPTEPFDFKEILERNPMLLLGNVLNSRLHAEKVYWIASPKLREKVTLWYVTASESCEISIRSFLWKIRHVPKGFDETESGRRRTPTWHGE